MTPQAKFILASASPRRRELLSAAGAPFESRVADIDETPLEGEAAEKYVVRLALEKAKRIAALVSLPVLAADTVVTIDGKLLGKPESAGDAITMLQSLRGRTHRVVTGVALQAHSFFESTEVTFRPLSDAEIEAYVRTGEPMDKAGAYAIQGRACSFVTRINGSYTNIVGLPVAETVLLLAKLGIWTVS